MRQNILHKFIEDALVHPPPQEIINMCGEWYSPYYNLFYLLSIDNPGIAVELGVDQGRGSAAFAYGGCETYGIDHTRKVGVDRLDNVSNFTFVQSDTMPKPRDPPDFIKSLKIDFLHIDTEHSYSMAKSEFEAYQPYLNDDAIVFFDDLHAQENAVQSYFRSLEYPKIEDDRLHPVNGFGVLLYE